MFYRLFETFGHPDEGVETGFSGGYDCHIDQSLVSDEVADKGTQHTSYRCNTGMLAYAHCEAEYGRTIEDYAYTLRYVARTGRKEHPWSERKMGVYHKQNGPTSLYIILQPTPTALELPARVSSSSPGATISMYSVLPHVLLFQSTLPAWKAYMQNLEGPVRNIVSYVFIHSKCSVHPLEQTD
jgi:hypothetical protein